MSIREHRGKVDSKIVRSDPVVWARKADVGGCSAKCSCRIGWKGARDILVRDTALNSRGDVVRALVDGDHFLEVSANQRWARIPRERRSWRLVGVRSRSVAVRLRSAHVCRVVDDVRSVTTFRTCSFLSVDDYYQQRCFLIRGAIHDPRLASPVDATIPRKPAGPRGHHRVQDQPCRVLVHTPLPAFRAWKHALLRIERAPRPASDTILPLSPSSLSFSLSLRPLHELR